MDYEQLTADDLARLSALNLTLPLTFDAIKHYLPHRYPFMLIDRVTAVSPDNWITGYKNLSINEELFNGHFPDNPIMPGVLMIEAMAQLSGILGFISAGVTKEDGYLYVFAGVDKARFKKLVIPGDRLYIKSKLTMSKRDIYKFECQALVEDGVVCTAEIMVARQKLAADSKQTQTTSTTAESAK